MFHTVENVTYTVEVCLSNMTGKLGVPLDRIVACEKHFVVGCDKKK
jgi:hypothetical protein